MKTMHFLLAATLAALGTSTFAQWQWIDKDGRKVFSDRAPTTDIPEQNILKRPNGRLPAPAAPADPAATDAPSAPAAAPLAPGSAKPSELDKELEAKKKKVQEEEAAKRKAAEEQNTKAKIESCARAKQAKATLESGVRIGRTNAAGEREYMDEAAKAEELKRIQSIMAKDCQ
jgi:type IV secretory pathway VirB10-like protein